MLNTKKRQMGAPSFGRKPFSRQTYKKLFGDQMAVRAVSTKHGVGQMSLGQLSVTQSVERMGWYEEER
jgi:hypothetical protein